MNELVSENLLTRGYWLFLYVVETHNKMREPYPRRTLYQRLTGFHRHAITITTTKAFLGMFCFTMERTSASEEGKSTGVSSFYYSNGMKNPLTVMFIPNIHQKIDRGVSFSSVLKTKWYLSFPIHCRRLLSRSYTGYMQKQAFS